MATVSLNDDGISEDFYNLLWTRDELNFGPSINIPDTIIFKYGSPTHWYFTATNGMIKKKNRQNLISARIEEAFSKYILGYDIVATFISAQSEPTEGATTTPAVQNEVQFFDRKALNDFLYSNKKDCSGILQRFIDPKSNKNEVIRAVWSPKICLLERAENIHFLHDMRYGLYERCVTCEGPDYYSISTPLRGPVLAGQIQKICESVVSHISEVTFNQKKISRAVINFKVDSRDKIWLLYSTSIRCEDDSIPAPVDHYLQKVERKLLNINSVLTLPTSVNLNPYKSYDKIIPHVKIRCISCGSETLDNMRHPVAYKSILKHFEHVLHIVKTIAKGQFKEKKLTWPPDRELIDAAGGVGFGCIDMVSDIDDISKASKKLSADDYQSDELVIPPIIRYLHPKLNATTYNRCKVDPLFLNKTVHVCEPCFLVYAEFSTMMLRLGADLNKILTPDPAASAALQASRAKSANRPSSADWREMSSINKSRSMTSKSAAYLDRSSSSANHVRAKESAIGIRSQDSRVQPDFPSPIRNSSDTMNYQFPTASQNHLLQGSLDSIESSQGSFFTNPAVADISPMDVSDMIADRERRFFKEIARNPQLRDQHPLMHLISSQQKLAVADQLSGVFTTKESAAKEGLFSHVYGRQTADRHDKLGPYRVIQPYVRNGVVTIMKPKPQANLTGRADSSRSPQRKPSTKSTGTIRTVSEEASQLTEDDNSNQTGRRRAEEQQAAAAEHLSKHQQFLAETLKQVGAEVTKRSTPAAGQHRKASSRKQSKKQSARSSVDDQQDALPGLGGTVLEGGDNDSTESQLLRSLGLAGKGDDGSVASQDDAYSFSRSIAEDQQLDEYGIGAAESLRDALRGGNGITKSGKSGPVEELYDDADDRASIGSSVSLNSSSAVKELVEALGV